MPNCQDIEPLIAGLLDQELTSEECEMVNTHFQKCEKCRQLFDSLRELDPFLCAPSFDEPADETLEKFWTSSGNRGLRKLSIGMILLSGLILVVWGFIEMVLSGMPPLLTVCVMTLFFGFILLFFTVLRERLQIHKQDPYKEVKR